MESILPIQGSNLNTCHICDGKYPTNKHNFVDCYSLDIDWDMVMMDNDFSILEEPHVINWFRSIKEHDDIESERAWGNHLIKKYKLGKKKYKLSKKKENVQWTTVLSEHIVKLLLILNGHTVIEKQKIKGFKMDIETTDRMFEVKARNFNTSGTAGEKVLGTPKKYAHIPYEYGKNMVIILCGFQEEEGIDKFKLFGGGSKQLNTILAFEKSLGFDYYKCSDLLKIITS